MSLVALTNAITRDRMIPAARDGLAAARAGYETGVARFGDVIEAERALRRAELEEQRAVGEQSRRAAECWSAGIAPAPPASAPRRSSDTGRRSHTDRTIDARADAVATGSCSRAATTEPVVRG
jgi:hypothetical protein